MSADDGLPRIHFAYSAVLNEWQDMMLAVLFAMGERRAKEPKGVKVGLHSMVT